MKSIEFNVLVRMPVTECIYDEGGKPQCVATEEYTEELKFRRMPYTEANEAIAKRDAYNGEYTIVDENTQFSIPTTEERVEALEAAVTMLCMPDVSEV